MKVTMLAENERDINNSRLKAQHGLSMLLETNNTRILFDTGASGIFVENAEVMGIDIKSIDAVVISHAHKDHSGGLIEFLERNHSAKVYMSIHAKEQYYLGLLGLKINISIPEQIFKKYGERIIFVENLTEITEEIFFVPCNFSQISRSNKNNLYVKAGNGFTEDSFKHEVMLVVKKTNGLVIFTGCSHNGLVEMVKYCRECFPQEPILSIIGGFHLMKVPFKTLLSDTKENIEHIGRSVLSMDVDKVYTCHCTGKKAFGILKTTMGNRLEYFHTGRQINV